MVESARNWLEKLSSPITTPLVNVDGIWVKREGHQIGKSAKYRLVYHRLSSAIRSEELKPGTTLCEASAGSTGLALALAAQALETPCEIHVYENASPSKIEAMKKLGAVVVRHPLGTSFLAIVQNLQNRMQQGQAWYLNQYAAEAKVAYQALADELWEQFKRIAKTEPNALFCPIGTGSLLQGLGSRLREKKPELRIIAIEPAEGHSIEGTRNTELVHLGAYDAYDRTFADETIRISSYQADILNLGDSSCAAMHAVALAGTKNAVVLSPSNKT